MFLVYFIFWLFKFIFCVKKNTSGPQNLNNEILKITLTNNQSMR
jgi:hypothetical protein